MRQIVLIIVLALVLLGAAGVLLLGAFPPRQAPAPISRTIPNDRFGNH